MVQAAPPAARVCRLVARLRSTGRLGFISLLTWQTGKNYRRLREQLLAKRGIVTVVNLPFDVFPQAYVDTGIYILSPRPTNRYQLFRFPKRTRATDLRGLSYQEVPRNLIRAPDYKLILKPTAHAIYQRAAQSPNFVPLWVL